MTVRAKMKVMHITKTGDAKKPSVQVKLGAVYSNDPESENRSFANATPSGELSLNIDAGRPAASYFELGGEYYIDVTAIGVPERFYLGDHYNVPHGEYMLESRDKSKSAKVTYGARGWVVDGKETYQVEKFKEMGFEFWRHLRDGE